MKRWNPKRETTRQEAARSCADRGVARGKGVFSKAAFKINVRDLTVTCPTGETERIAFGMVTDFGRRYTGRTPRGRRIDVSFWLREG